MNTLDPEDPNRLLATGLAMALAASGRSRQDVAHDANISTTHVTKLLMGKVNPSQKVLLDLAIAVNHSVAEIYELGEEAIQREKQAIRRQASHRAEDEKSVEAIVELASLLEPEALRELIHQLQLMEEEFEDELSTEVA